MNPWITVELNQQRVADLRRHPTQRHERTPVARGTRRRAVGWWLVHTGMHLVAAADRVPDRRLRRHHLSV
jgi:hypothetical protein